MSASLSLDAARVEPAARAIADLDDELRVLRAVHAAATIAAEIADEHGDDEPSDRLACLGMHLGDQMVLARHWTERARTATTAEEARTAARMIGYVRLEITRAIKVAGEVVGEVRLPAGTA